MASDTAIEPKQLFLDLNANLFSGGYPKGEYFLLETFSKKSLNEEFLTRKSAFSSLKYEKFRNILL